MAFLVHNVPSIKCFVRAEFLYNQDEAKKGQLIPCVWLNLKSIRGQAWRVQVYLPEYGALYDKLPLHAFQAHEWPIERSYPLDFLQLWDCPAYDFTVTTIAALRGARVKVLMKDRQFAEGEYLFTADHCHPDWSLIDTSWCETHEEHKSFNFIQLDNGQYAAQPNNRTLFIDPSLTPAAPKRPDFHVAMEPVWSVERHSRWALGDTTTVDYDGAGEPERS